MDCPNHKLLNDYTGDELNPVERMMVREHLVRCQECRSKINELKLIENALRDPIILEPSVNIEKNVMKLLFPQTPSRISLIVLLSLSFALFIALLFVFFDISNNGVLNALQFSGFQTTSFLGTLIRMMTGSFKVIYAFYKIFDAFTRVLTFGLMSIEMLLLILSIPGLIGVRLILRRRDAWHAE